MRGKFKKIKITHSYKIKRRKIWFPQIEFECDKFLFIVIKIIFAFLLLAIFLLLSIKKYTIDNVVKISNYINIGTNIDNKYIYPFIVFLTSLLDNRAKSTFYIIHILKGNDLSNNTYDKVNSVIERFGKDFCNISYYDMGEQFKGATSGQYISTASYYKISFPSLLPNVDKIIFSDSDVLNLEDLSEMYNIPVNDSIYFCGVLDFVGLISEITPFGYDRVKYMNAGIFLMNLKAIRNNSIEENIRQFISSHFLNHHDQTAINAICYDHIKILPYKFATFALFNSTEQIIKFNNEQNEKYRYNETELIQALEQPVSLHYAGWTKPWHKKYNLLNSAYWWYYAKKSGFYQEILENYEFLENETEALLKTIPNDGGILKRNYKK